MTNQADYVCPCCGQTGVKVPRRNLRRDCYNEQYRATTEQGGTARGKVRKGERAKSWSVETSMKFSGIKL